MTKILNDFLILVINKVKEDAPICQWTPKCYEAKE